MTMRFNDTLLKQYAQRTVSDLTLAMGFSSAGLRKSEADRNRRKYGSNSISTMRTDSLRTRLRRAFFNPFSVVLMFLALISFLVDSFVPPDPAHNRSSVFIICCMLLLSGSIRFVQELKAKKVTDNLVELVDTPILVKRDGSWVRLHPEELAVGDYVALSSGERVPADMRITSASDCFVSESVLTGESALREKTPEPLKTPPSRITDFSNCLFLGTTLMNGSCEGIVLAVGSHTLYGGVAPDLLSRKKGFERGSNSIAWVLIRFMIILVPFVFIASGLTKGDWLYSFLFALSVAVGLTPELLPMVITACLAKGSYTMGKKQTVVKNINAMQAFGNMDVLCVDKTGTLTQDTLLLEYYMDILGNENMEVLDCTYLNSYFHAGIRNHLDTAILKSVDMPRHQEHFRVLPDSFLKLDEIPFDFTRKTSSVLLRKEEQNLLIMKGAVDEVTKHCNRIFFQGKVIDIKEDPYESVHAVVDDMLNDGMKVLAVAVKKTDYDTIVPASEEQLILIGYIAFFDAPKESAASALLKLKDQNIAIKVLTGDHAGVASSICRRLGIAEGEVMTGALFDTLTDNDAQIRVEQTSVFAELSPSQKEAVVRLLESNGHTVGFLGDGVNDLPAVLSADVGISVDTAAPSLKECADVILLKKDLDVLEEGISEGRRAFSNMNKYVKITASSNLGNIISIVIASIFLPFFPMTSVQLLLLNLLYDTLCLILPWDKVDPEQCRRPLEWNGRNLSSFMLFFGPISSFFDLLFFGFLFFGLCPKLAGGSFFTLSAGQESYFISLFQTGWFLESMWSQTLILHLLRTEKLPFLESRPSAPVLFVTVCGISLFTVLATSSFGGWLGMSPLPPVYFGFLIPAVLCYLLVVTAMKRIYIQKTGRLI